MEENSMEAIRMTMPEALEILQEHYGIKEAPKEVPHGKMVKLDNGATITVYTKGTFQVQGADSEKIKMLLDSRSDCKNTKASANRNVFVVYGHDTASRNELEIILHRWGLTPLILEKLPSKGQTIIEKLEENIEKASFAIVLLTPDDEGRIAGVETGLMGRARQNVILEMGMLLAKLGRKKVAILHKKTTELELPSDVNGLMYISFDKAVEESKSQLAKDIQEAMGLIITANMM